jgi:hypothetical protein
MKSLLAASRLGYFVNSNLPLLDDIDFIKPVEDVVGRLLCLHALAASSYGFDRTKARLWLTNENLWDSLVNDEREFINGRQGDSHRFKVQVEGMWAIAWALQVVPGPVFDHQCDSNFVLLFPNLKSLEGSQSFRSKLLLRRRSDIIAACDLAYCLHWAVRQSSLICSNSSGQLPDFVIIERRRALEWMLSGKTWNEISLDT